MGAWTPPVQTPPFNLVTKRRQARRMKPARRREVHHIAVGRHPVKRKRLRRPRAFIIQGFLTVLGE